MTGLGRVLMVLAWLLPAMAAAQPANPAFPGATETERWVWQELRAGRIADLNARCGATLDPRDSRDPRWRNECRRLSSGYLEWLLTTDGWRAAPAHRGVRISGARVDGRLELSGAKVDMPVWLHGCLIESEATLSDTRFASLVLLEGTVFLRGLFADRIQVDGSLLLRNGAAVRDGALVLLGAKIGGDLSLERSSFETGIAADSLLVGGSLFLRNDAIVRGRPLTLRGAKIGGDLLLGRSSFDAGIQADNINVGGSLSLSGGAAVRGASVRLVGAKIGGNLGMDGSSFEAGIEADSLTVGGSLFLRNGARVGGGPLVLRGAKIGGDLAIYGSRIAAEVQADGIAVADNLFLRSGEFREGLEFVLARIGALVDISDAALRGLSLRGAVIGGELRLGSGNVPAPRWSSGAEIDLRNLRAGALGDRQDSTVAPPAEARCAGEDEVAQPPHAWPCRVRLQGFTFDRLGGLSGGGGREMLVRDAGYYTALLARDPTEAFSRQPYQQFAGAFRAIGDKGRADAILYAAREREMAHLWQVGDCGIGLGLLRFQRECWAAVGLFALKWTIGYGLAGGYWWAVAWVVVVTLIGVVVIGCSPYARAKGLLWCFGASLDRLLPIIDLSAEFARFFDDPDRERLKAWQIAYFAAHSVAGYVLAAFVAAAMAGLTQAE